LAAFLHKKRSPLADRTDSFVKNSGHFIEFLKSVNLRGKEILVSFDVVRLFTNVPVDEALQDIRSRLDNENTLAEPSVLKVEAVKELLDVCLRTTLFQDDVGFCQQKNGIAMGSSHSPIVSKISMEHFEQVAVDSAQDKPSLWL
jgi:hypothetical protein